MTWNPTDDNSHGISKDQLFEQATQALAIEFGDLLNTFDMKLAREIFLRVLLNSLVDHSFNSEEYQDIQNDRLITLASIFVILMNQFENDPQSYIDAEQLTAVTDPNTGKPVLTMIYRNITNVLGQELEIQRMDV
jgi:hypothetical protein